MKKFACCMLALTMTVVATPRLAAAQAPDAEFRAQFQAVIDDLNDDSFKSFRAAIDKGAMLDRIFGGRVIDPAVKESFAGDFAGSIESIFVGAFPRPRNESEANSEIIGTIIDFRSSGDRARAIVRFAAKGYRYSYHAYELARENGRLVIVDWLDYYNGAWFSALTGGALVRAVPSKPAARSILSLPKPDDGQLFQVGELLKAARDGNGQRFFQIYDALDEVLQREREIAVLYLMTARGVNHRGRMAQAAEAFRTRFPDDDIFSLALAEHYIAAGAFPEAIEQFERFQRLLGLRDGVTESYKASAALAMSDHEAAEAFAVAATEVEPGLELSWWSLLRARTGAGDYAGATEALTRLEDDFGEALTPQKLRRDRFLKVLADQQAYIDWRAGRD